MANQSDVAASPRWPAPEIDLRALAAVLMRRRWVALVTLAAALLAGVLLTVRAPRVYRAEAVVLIDSAAPEVLGSVREVVDLGASGYWVTKEYYETQYVIMRSRPVAQKAAVALGLAPKVMAARVRAAGPEPLEARVAGDPLRDLPADLREPIELLGLSGVRTRERLAAVLDDLDAAAYLQGMVSVQPVKDSRLAAVAVESKSPQRAARLANAMADAYIEYNLDQKVAVTRAAASWLSDQMHELKDQLRESELALYEFKKANNVVSVPMEDRRSMTAETLSQLNRSLGETTAARLALESRRDRLARAEKLGVPPEAFEEVAASKLIEQLRASYGTLMQEKAELGERYTAEHPKLVAIERRLALVRATLDDEIGKVAAAVEEQYQTALDTERRLREAIEKVKAEALELNKKEIEYNRLRRERDNNEALYELVLKREKEADLSELLRVNNVRKLEAAQPASAPVSPRPAVDLTVALVLGLLAAVAAAFLVDHLDDTVKSQAQIEQLLGARFLGVIPTIAAGEGAGAGPGRRDLFVADNPRSSVAECCRAIRTGLLFASHERRAQRILVTSSAPQEGKSTTAVSLAVTLAQAGARTILVDTDLRRPRLHESFGLEPSAGVSSVILGEVALRDAIRRSGVDGLDVLPCGPLPPNPAELLHAASFQRLVEELARSYERIVLDSPPVGAVADALVLARLVDGVVLVVKAGKTHWPDALETSRRLASVGAVLFGAVLNGARADGRRDGPYHYYEYYRARPDADREAAG